PRRDIQRRRLGLVLGALLALLLLEPLDPLEPDRQGARAGADHGADRRRGAGGQPRHPATAAIRAARAASHGGSIPVQRRKLSMPCCSTISRPSPAGCPASTAAATR